MVRSIFSESIEESPEAVPSNMPIKHGRYFGGIYNNRKYLYSESMIDILPIGKLESIIKKQIGYEKDS